MPRQFDEVRGDDRGIEFQGLDAGVLLPIQAFAFNPVGKMMALFRRLLSRNFDIAEIDLALYFPGIQTDFFS